MRLALVFFSLLVSLAISETTLYLINLDSGQALSYDGTTLKFADKTFGDKSQLWKFYTNGTLLVLHNDEYLGTNSNDQLEMRQAGDVTWSWEDMRLVLKNPAKTLCVSSAADKAVMCNSTTAAKITLHLFEEDIQSAVKDIDYHINVTSADLERNITNLETVSLTLKTLLEKTQTNIDDWNITLQNKAQEFKKTSLNVTDTISIKKGRLEKDINQLNDKTAPLTTALANVSTHLKAIHFNFTSLLSDLSSFNTTTQEEVTSRLTDLSDIMEEKSTNGHMTPDNLYEFTAIFLLALGIINIMDIARRLIKYSIHNNAENRSATKYGAD